MKDKDNNPRESTLNSFKVEMNAVKERSLAQSTANQNHIDVLEEYLNFLERHFGFLSKHSNFVLDKTLDLTKNVFLVSISIYLATSAFNEVVKPEIQPPTVALTFTIGSFALWILVLIYAYIVTHHFQNHGKKISKIWGMIFDWKVDLVDRKKKMSAEITKIEKDLILLETLENSNRKDS